jgi:hypothetical protein
MSKLLKFFPAKTEVNFGSLSFNIKSKSPVDINNEAFFKRIYLNTIILLMLHAEICELLSLASYVS